MNNWDSNCYAEMANVVPDSTHLQMPTWWQIMNIVGDMALYSVTLGTVYSAKSFISVSVACFRCGRRDYLYSEWTTCNLLLLWIGWFLQFVLYHTLEKHMYGLVRQPYCLTLWMSVHLFFIYSLSKACLMCVCVCVLANNFWMQMI